MTLLGPAADSGPNLNTMFDDSASNFVPATASKSRFSVLRQHLQAVHAAVASSRHRHSGNRKLEICNAGTVKVTLNRWVLVVPEISDFRVYLPVIRRS